jgi:anthraniloyl-CoA monooxygenase
MRIACVGGGPGGLFFAILAKQIAAVESVTVFERSPEGVTFGWGVVFWDELLEALEEHDAPTGRAVREAAFTWHDQIIDVRGAGDGGPPVNLGGHGYAMNRREMRGLLIDRARELGVEVRFDHAVTDVGELSGYDLVVAADGVNSVLRSNDPAFGTTVERGRNKYIWLGTGKVFESFTFPFVRAGSGWMWAHAYGYSDSGDASGSTFVVETTPQVWDELGFGKLGPADTMRVLEKLFAEQLDGHTLTTSSPDPDVTPWLEFRTVRNTSWHHGNLVLLGDAAHTTHFTIGSGTRLALLDSMALADALRASSDVGQAAAAYERRRVAELAPVAAEADASAGWFENIDSYIRHGSRGFATLLVDRRRFLARRLPGAYLGLRKARRAAAATPLAQPAKRVVRRLRSR